MSILSESNLNQERMHEEAPWNNLGLPNPSVLCFWNCAVTVLMQMSSLLKDVINKIIKDKKETPLIELYNILSMVERNEVDTIVKKEANYKFLKDVMEKIRNPDLSNILHNFFEEGGDDNENLKEGCSIETINCSIWPYLQQYDDSLFKKYWNISVCERSSCSCGVSFGDVFNPIFDGVVLFCDVTSMYESKNELNISDIVHSVLKYHETNDMSTCKVCNGIFESSIVIHTL